MGSMRGILGLLSLLVMVVLGDASACCGQPADAAQAAKDARVVETLLRLKTVDPDSKPEVKAAVLRHLETIAGTARHLEIVEALKIEEAADGLVAAALARSEEPYAIDAARTVVRLGEEQRLYDAFESGDETTRLALIRLWGGLGNASAAERLQTLVQDAQQTRELRQAAVSALLQSGRGQATLAERIESGSWPADLMVFTAAELSRIGTDELKARLASKLNLPETADAMALPSIDVLIGMTGDVAVGKQAFFGKGTCANCHVVGGEGKEVGPNLSEIGSKLSRDAMLVSILDPSAAISHNFETFVAQTIDGEILLGILTSRTEQDVVLRLADGQVRTIETEFLDALDKQTVSLMPQGLQKNLTVDELVSLIDYLMTLKKP